MEPDGLTPQQVFERDKGSQPPVTVLPHLTDALNAALAAKDGTPEATVKRARAYAKFLEGGWMATTVLSVHITNPGRNYTQPPAVVFDSGPNKGTLAAARATVTNGEVSAVTLLHGGEGYVIAPAVRLEGGGGEGATAVAILKDVE
jgi:hypothetical protein